MLVVLNCLGENMEDKSLQLVGILKIAAKFYQAKCLSMHMIHLFC